MKKKTIIPMAFAAALLFGCASSNDTMNNNTTAMDTTTTMSETQTMAGDTQPQYDVVVDPVATYEELFTNTTDQVDYNDMFEHLDNTEQHDVLTLAKSSPNLSNFVRLIEIADLEQDLMRLDEYTVFAPTNDAFAEIPRDQMEMLLMPENKAKLKQILQTHVLPNKVSANQFNTTQRIQIGEDRFIPVDVTMDGTNVTIGGANIVRSNVEASNGFIHVVDSVILPEEAAVEGATGVGGY